MPTGNLSDIQEAAAPAASGTGTGKLSDIEGPAPTPEHPDYWHELWQQSGIPGLVEGIKKNPAGTVATALGGLLSLVKPGYDPVPEAGGRHISVTEPTQMEQAADIGERGPAAVGAAATLGAIPLASKLPKELPGTIATGVKAAAPGVTKGLGKVALGAALEAVPLPGPVKAGLGFSSAASGARDIGRAIVTGYRAARAPKAAPPPGLESLLNAAKQAQPGESLPPSVMADLTRESELPETPAAPAAPPTNAPRTPLRPPLTTPAPVQPPPEIGQQLNIAARPLRTPQEIAQALKDEMTSGENPTITPGAEPPPEEMEQLNQGTEAGKARARTARATSAAQLAEAFRGQLAPGDLADLKPDQIAAFARSRGIRFPADAEARQKVIDATVANMNGRAATEAALQSAVPPRRSAAVATGKARSRSSQAGKLSAL